MRYYLYKQKYFNTSVSGQDGSERKYALALTNIEHAKKNLPVMVYTEDPELTKQVHNLYVDCLFDKVWEPALPGLPYKWMSITGAGDQSYGKCQLQWDPMFVLNAWASLDDDELIREIFKNYWNVIDNNPEAPKGSYRYGMIPCVTNPDLPQNGFAQIPILAWGCKMIFDQTNDFELLEQSIPYLDKYLTWYNNERDVDDDGLIEYGAYKRISIGDMVQTARFETFDFHATLDGLELTEHPSRGSGGAWYGNIEGVEQTSFLAISERAMIELCDITGRLEMKEKYEKRLAKRTKAIQTKMWDPETKFFYSLNRDTDEKIRIRTLQGFLTLTAGLASEEQAKELVRQLKDPSLFWSKYPVTTSAMDEPTFKPDGFWRGDMWPPTHYLVALGLNRYGYFDIAIDLAEKMQELLDKYDGHAYERYNGVDGKGLGVKDYCWGIAAWSIAVNTIYGIQEDYKTIVIPPGAKGRHLKLGKLEVKYLSDSSVELKTSFERKFSVIFPAQTDRLSVLCDGEILKKEELNIEGSKVTFTGMPGKTYVVSDPKYFAGSLDKLLIPKPEHGYVTNTPAHKWEEAMLTGNGTLGALVMGYPLKESIIFSHEKLFMPENPPTPAPDFGGSMDLIRKLVRDGDTKKAVDLSIKLGADVGVPEYYWTDPFIPACQMEIEDLDNNPLLNYSRSVNYETGEATAAWTTKNGNFKRSVFSSRKDGVICVRFKSEEDDGSNFRIKLSQLPLNDEESGDVIEDVIYTATNNGTLKYTTLFRKKWEGSLKGYTVETRIADFNGIMKKKGDWLYFENCSDITLHIDISLSYDLPVSTETELSKVPDEDYPELLNRHAIIHGEIFNRFSLSLGDQEETYLTPDQLIQSSSYGNLNKQLLVQLCEAGRYINISATGHLPPSLVGIWGGTWRPEWSGDFTLNGNVPANLSGGLNTNFQEIIEAYINYMWSMMNDFRDNARNLYGAPGIFVPSRSSDSGKTYHYGSWHPHLFWFAGGAWTAQIFYDYWQYTGDKKFLEEKAIPLMVEAAEFLEFIITEDEGGGLIFLPSYSPEVGPMKEKFEGHHMLAINATMDIASFKQLLRNLLSLVDSGLLESEKVKKWKDIVKRLPDYEIDQSGDLKEWIWPGLENNNRHRHASHLYPLFYEIDPDFVSHPELKKAAVTAIEKRLSYRRDKNGAEMAFGLVQTGLAAAHIQDTEHAYECVDWLCNSYWSPAFTAYHDPGRIFNMDICGGLPAVVCEMLVQSSANRILILPALPAEWPSGEVKGVATRCGATIDLKWEDGKPVSAVIHAKRKSAFSIQYKDRDWKFELDSGQIRNWTFD